MDRRQRKVERVRGSGQRNVQAEAFSIVNNSNIPKNLQSALNNDVRDLPRLRRRSSLARVDTSYSEEAPLRQRKEPTRSTPRKQAAPSSNARRTSSTGIRSTSNTKTAAKSPKSPATVKKAAKSPVATNKISKRTASTSSTNTPRRSLPRSSKPTKIREIPSDDDLETTLENSSIEYAKSWIKRKGSASNKRAGSEGPRAGSASPEIASESPTSSYNESEEEQYVETPRAKLRRIKSDVTKRVKALKKGSDGLPSSRKKPKIDTPQVSKVSKKLSTRKAPQASVSTETLAQPVPLSKTRLSEAQKPLVINVERLTTHRNRDRRTKITTVDVIKQLAHDFVPASNSPKEARLHDEFKQYLNNHLDYLMDIHSSINDLSSKISQVQRLKNEIRSEIYEVKKSHAIVGDNLNKLRRESKQEHERHDKFNQIFEKLNSLSQNQPVEDSLDFKVASDLHKLQRIVNPSSGVFQKLVMINDTLSKLEKEL